MPKGIGVIRWNNQLGPYLDIKYPEDVTLTSPEVVNIYTAQTMGDIAKPRFSALDTDNFKIVSYFGGMEDPSMLILFLEKYENSDDFRNSLIDAFMSMPKETPSLNQWLPQIWENFKKLQPKKEQDSQFQKKLGKILSELNAREIFELNPEFNFEKGVIYPQLKDIKDISGLELKRLLEQLANIGYLIREIVDGLLTCPDCSSTKLQIKLICPICNFNALEKTLITEHFICGLKTISRKFITSTGMFCPKCNLELKTDGIDYTNVGIFYYCHKCKNYFNIPSKFLLCHNCGLKFPEENANLTNIIGYKVNKEQLRKFLEDPDKFLIGER